MSKLRFTRTSDGLPSLPPSFPPSFPPSLPSDVTSQGYLKNVGDVLLVLRQGSREDIERSTELEDGASACIEGGIEGGREGGREGGET